MVFYSTALCVNYTVHSRLFFCKIDVDIEVAILDHRPRWQPFRLVLDPDDLTKK